MIFVKESSRGRTLSIHCFMLSKELRIRCASSKGGELEDMTVRGGGLRDGMQQHLCELDGRCYNEAHLDAVGTGATLDHVIRQAR